MRSLNTARNLGWLHTCCLCCRVWCDVLIRYLSDVVCDYGDDDYDGDYNDMSVMAVLTPLVALLYSRLICQAPLSTSYAHLTCSIHCTFC